MLIAVGWSVRIPLLEGGTATGAPHAALLHDPTGRHWSKCSGLVTTITKRGEACDDERALKYLGTTAHQGTAALPPRDLGAWKMIGHAASILYSRHGKNAGKYEHEFGQHRVAGFVVGVSDSGPRVYARGAALRIELGAGCVWDERGIVAP
jgi:hypothetical protein